MSALDVSQMLACPVPIEQYPTVLLAHGGGGRLMHQLIERMIVPAFANPALAVRHDGALLPVPSSHVAFTTDSYVVRPIEFPGGDIASLAVYGTVNDLAMCGARPLYLSVGFILEEGLPMETLWRIVQSMRRCADEAGVWLVTGDTKVVDHGSGDGIFINTAGIGLIEHDRAIEPRSVRAGDAVVLSGDIGRHGVAILSAREGLELETAVESDCAPLARTVLALLDAGLELHCMRDLTRGGLGSALIEISEAGAVRIAVDENAIEVCDGVQGVCEILGFDPLYLANEGRFVAFVPADQAELACAIIDAHGAGTRAAIIGHVHQGEPLVTMRSSIGATRIVEMMSGEQLPRIC
jgi:hydrogenase expression/formation protein HypE